MNKPVSPFQFDNTYARDLEGLYVEVDSEKAPKPQLLRLNRPLAEELRLDPTALESDHGIAVLAGASIPEGAQPLAQAYAGHQFGGFSPQLGDGRALLLGEIIDRAGNRRDLQLKGSGRTPFSRSGDGKAAIGPVLREYIMGEAMHALGIPTTRALAAVATGEAVQREVPLPGAVLTRVAASHIRVGTFQFFAARGEADKLRKLADYSIDRHFPELRDAANPYLAFLEAVSDAQARLIAQWMQVGFVHGVMNTDNMAISGETIDYGPCAFMDAYSADTVFSSIDCQGRYAYGNQPVIAQWNLARLAETLLGLIDPVPENAARLATNVINSFPADYAAYHLAGMRGKIGLVNALEGDLDLVDSLLASMEGQGADFTLVFRRLSQAVRGDDASVRALFADSSDFDRWLPKWLARSEQEPATAADRADAMDRANPIYVPRNHLVEAALSAAQAGDLSVMDRLLGALEHPFSEINGFEDHALPAPAGSVPYTTFCGT